MLIDILFILSLLYGIWMGMTKGFFTAASNFFKIIIAFLLALKFSYLASGTTAEIMGIGGSTLPLVSFVLTFLVILFFIQSLNKYLLGKTNSDSYSLVQKGSGMLIWFFFLCTAFSTIIWFGEQSDILSPQLITTSSVYPIVEPIYPILSCRFDFISPAFHDIFNSIQNLFYGACDAAKGECYS